MLNEAMDTAINDPLHSVAEALDPRRTRGGEGWRT